MQKIIDRLDFSLWKSSDRYILSVSVEQGAIGRGIDLLLDVDEAETLLSNITYLELKVRAVQANPELFIADHINIKDFE